MTKLDQPEAAPPVVERAVFDEALAAQVTAEKDVTRHGDRVSASRRNLPMVEVADYTFTGPNGPVRLSDLFADRYLLLVQNVMFAPEWDDGCPSCSWAVDNLPANMERLTREGIAFALISQAPIDKLEAWRAKQSWGHTWVSSYDTRLGLDADRGRRQPGAGAWLLVLPAQGRQALPDLHDQGARHRGHPAARAHHGSHRLRQAAGLGGQSGRLAAGSDLRMTTTEATADS